MYVMNAFIQRNLNRMTDYFRKLCEVVDLDAHRKVCGVCWLFDLRWIFEYCCCLKLTVLLLVLGVVLAG